MQVRRTSCPLSLPALPAAQEVAKIREQTNVRDAGIARCETARETRGKTRTGGEGRAGRDARIMNGHHADKPGLPAVLAQRAWCRMRCRMRRTACGIAGGAGLIELRALPIGGELSRAKSRMRSSQGTYAEQSGKRCERSVRACRQSASDLRHSGIASRTGHTNWPHELATRTGHTNQGTRHTVSGLVRATQLMAFPAIE